MMKIEDYLESLPSSIMSGDDVQLPDNSFRTIFDFVNLSENDVFYHLGCGNGKGLAIALEEYHVKKVVGIDIDKNKINEAKQLLKEKNLEGTFHCKNIVDFELEDPTVILFWFTDSKIIETMMKKFEKLPRETKIVTIWGPLPGCLPDEVDFPYILNKVPFRPASDIRDQLLAVFDARCIDFVNAWEFAERYTKAIGNTEPENARFLTILQSLVIWINAKNLGIACGEQMPPAIKNYIGILRSFFNIEVEHLLEKK